MKLVCSQEWHIELSIIWKPECVPNGCDHTEVQLCEDCEVEHGALQFTIFRTKDFCVIPLDNIIQAKSRWIDAP